MCGYGNRPKLGTRFQCPLLYSGRIETVVTVQDIEAVQGGDDCPTLFQHANGPGPHHHVVR